jgi:hypothetical protein
MAVIFGQGGMFAQEGGQTTQTHAEATSQQWKGIDVNTVLNGNFPDDNTIESGFPFLLYNVGTGRFIMQGGDWAMEGRLFFSDFGRQMYLYSNGRINAGITESATVTKNSFCTRPPEPTGKTSWTSITEANLTTLMDGDTKWGNYPMTWHFERVEAASNTETYTYYMYQTSKSLYKINAPNASTGSTYHNKQYGGKNFYLGAAWGECHNTINGKGDGQFVFMDDDRSCWTTVDVLNENTIEAVSMWDTTTENGVYVKQENGKAMLENGDLVDIQKLYQWRLISIDEFIDKLNSNGIGLNPSISSLIKDRDFTRNSNDFFGAHDWTVSTLSGYTYGPYNNTDKTTKHYAYTWGDYRKGQSNLNNNNHQSRGFINEPWDTPVRLKEVFDKVTSTSTNDQAAGKKNAKYGYMIFEGVGTVTSNFTVTLPGWYEIECAGFSMSEKDDHDAYLFARVISDNQINTPESSFAIPNEETEDDPTYGQVTLEKMRYDAYQKNNYENCLEVGKELLRNRDNHRQKVWVLVSQEDFDAGKKTIRLGFRKDAATQSDVVVKNNNRGYYDTDWVCVDDIRASYMGIGPVFFYEDEEDLRYLSQEDADEARFTPNEYAPAVKSGRYSGSVNLQRKFTRDEWNTFSFPLPLTGEQVRNAFGDDCELLKLNSIGNLSRNDCIIDFETVNLLTLDPVVTAGNLYMLKPTKEPAYGETPRGNLAYYYDLGKMFFSTKGDAEDPDYKYPKMKLDEWSGGQNVDSYNNTNDGCGHVTYTQTPGFKSFRVTGGRYNGDVAPEDSYAPKGSYAMSGGKMYELSRDTPIKGFRGWITLTHSIFDNASSAAAGSRIAIDGVIDGETSSIEWNTIVPVNPNTITDVYDLSGRKVGTSVSNLPKGLYIVGGKKLLVK